MRLRVVSVVVLVSISGLASAQIIQPGAPGQPSREISATEAIDRSAVQPTAADVRFMREMIGHHAQAIEMTALVTARTTREDLRLLALRIEVSQADEIKMMEHWLEAHGAELPDPHALHMHGAVLMPGMLSADEMARLADSKDSEFVRLFLEGMIKHHQGALVMVKDLFAQPGAAQASDVFAFVSDIDADQRIEIDRMRGMLNAR